MGRGRRAWSLSSGVDAAADLRPDSLTPLQMA